MGMLLPEPGLQRASLRLGDPCPGRREDLDLVGQYNKAISSWINRTSVCMAWHELPHVEGCSWHGLFPGERRVSLGAEDKKAQSIHTFTDAAAFTRGSRP
ncbi:hypothetical protein GCM10010289_80070 [Streptomyces violascens]|nr:hypothetical protein GCM10010289_80070 [Streptomyces violascens]